MAYHTTPPKGHVFGADLVCTGRGCLTSWGWHQAAPRSCNGVHPKPQPTRSGTIEIDRELGVLCLRSGVTYPDIAHIIQCNVSTVGYAFTKHKGITGDLRGHIYFAATELLRRRGVAA